MPDPIVLYPVLMILVLFGPIGGVRGYRGGADDWMWIGVMILVACVSAGLCWVVGMGKSGYMLAGLIGILSFFVLLCVAGALGIGAAIGMLLRWIFPLAGPKQEPATEKPSFPAFPQPSTLLKRPGIPWDVALICCIAGLGVVLSLLEKG
ncbi:MAG: hypothetical protein ACK5LJ_09995 [Paracoccus sp. (in: a-proteobacteria)]